jgi:hypothetical protein
MIGGGSTALGTVIKNGEIFPKVFGKHQHILKIALNFLRFVRSFGHGKMLGKDGERVYQNLKAIAVLQALLCGGQLLKAEEALPLFNAFGIDLCGG